jgi:hypothetical protein
MDVIITLSLEGRVLNLALSFKTINNNSTCKYVTGLHIVVSDNTINAPIVFELHPFLIAEPGKE